MNPIVGARGRNAASRDASQPRGAGLAGPACPPSVRASVRACVALARPGRLSGAPVTLPTTAFGASREARKTDAPRTRHVRAGLHVAPGWQGPQKGRRA
eukprot:gene8897-biopygen4557